MGKHDTQEHKDGYTGPHRFTMDGWISAAPFERYLHMEIVSARDGKATLKMPFLIDLAQGAGIMHGGAVLSLADTAVVMAIKVLRPGPISGPHRWRRSFSIRSSRGSSRQRPGSWTARTGPSGAGQPCSTKRAEQCWNFGLPSR